MNKQFHQIAPCIVLKFMPIEFQEFIIKDNFTIEKLMEIADYPDLVDKDSIENDALCKHDHSWKLDLVNNKIHWKDGNAVGRVKNLSVDAHDFYKEKNFDMVRYSLAKMTHYIIDSQTFPHNYIGEPWSKYHEKFETELGKFIKQHQKELENMTFDFKPCDDIYKYCSQLAKDRWNLGQDIVEKYENNIPLSNEEKIEICISSIQAIGDIWLTIFNVLKIK